MKIFKLRLILFPISITNDRIQFGIECGDEKYRRDILLRNVDNSTYLEKAKILNKSNIPYGLNAIIGFIL